MAGIGVAFINISHHKKLVLHIYFFTELCQANPRALVDILFYSQCFGTGTAEDYLLVCLWIFFLLSQQRYKLWINKKKIWIETSRYTLIVVCPVIYKAIPHRMFHLSNLHIHFLHMLILFLLAAYGGLSCSVLTLQAHKVLLMEQIPDDGPHHWIMASSSFQFPWCFLKGNLWLLIPYSSSGRII